MQGHIFREAPASPGECPQLLSPAPLGPPTPPFPHFLSPKHFALLGLPVDQIPASPQTAHHKALTAGLLTGLKVGGPSMVCEGERRAIIL